MRVYLEQLQSSLDTGSRRGDRTGVCTLSCFGQQTRYRMSDGFPAMTTKRLAWKLVVSELLWFISGSSNINDLKKIYSLASLNPYKKTFVIAVSLTPWKGYQTWSTQKQRNTEIINDFILSKPDNVDAVVDAYSLLGDSRDTDMLHPQFRKGDMLHPRGLGQCVIGAAVSSQIHRLFRLAQN